MFFPFLLRNFEFHTIGSMSVAGRAGSVYGDFRILKRNSDVVFDAEHEFQIRISFRRTKNLEIVFF